eukprot:m.94719 g.94719  ORF g.94719 m.94719 type:complete len:342 (-) comp8580_c0_seq1:226-1251(-)
MILSCLFAFSGHGSLSPSDYFARSAHGSQCIRSKIPLRHRLYWRFDMINTSGTTGLRCTKGVQKRGALGPLQHASNRRCRCAAGRAHILDAQGERARAPGAVDVGAQPHIDLVAIVQDEEIVRLQQAACDARAHGHLMQLDPRRLRVDRNAHQPAHAVRGRGLGHDDRADRALAAQQPPPFGLVRDALLEDLALAEPAAQRADLVHDRAGLVLVEHVGLLAMPHNQQHPAIVDEALPFIEARGRTRDLCQDHTAPVAAHTEQAGDVCAARARVERLRLAAVEVGDEREESLEGGGFMLLELAVQDDRQLLKHLQLRCAECRDIGVLLACTGADPVEDLVRR